MNSTLGTSKFVGFDKLMHYKKVTPSESILFYILPEECDAGELLGNYNGTGDPAKQWSNTTATSFKISTLNGRIDIKFDVTISITQYERHDDSVLGVIGLMKNNEEIGRKGGYRVAANNGTGGSQTISVYFPNVIVTPGDKFWISLTLSSERPETTNTGSIAISSNVNINGTLSDYIDYELY